MYRFSLRPPSGGFTLQEMLVTLAIAAILAAGTVGVRGFVQEHRLRAELNLLMGHIHLARSEAIKRGSRVTLCKSTDAATCSTATEWTDGWILFADNNGDDERQTDEPLLRVQSALAGDLTVRFGEAGTYHYLTYKPNGSGWPNATFTFCDARGASRARAIIVHRTGRARASTKKSDGSPLTCP